MPTIVWEIITLVLIIGAVIGFFTNFKLVISIYVGFLMFVVGCIVSGFFMAIGIDIYHAMVP
jgi:type IV secretory pathway TrbL component